MNKADKIRKHAEYKEYKTVLSDIESSAKYGLFSTERRIMSESTIKKLEHDGFDVRVTNYNNVYNISWRNVK